MAPSTRLRRISSHLTASTVSEVEFVTLEDAAKMDGLRVTFIPGMPAVFSECLKNLLDVKRVKYTRVIHPPMGKGDNQALLYQLTAQKSLPTMLYNDERPRNSWIEQIVLADKLGVGPSLLPADPTDRVLMWGLMNELAGEDGIIWQKRLLFGESALTKKYGYSEEAAREAPGALAASLRLFKERLEKQRASGSRYLVGSSLTVLDIYFATASIMLDPPGEELMPRTKQNAMLLKMFATNPPQVQAALQGEWLREYRNNIYKNHLVTPAVLGGSPM